LRFVFGSFGAAFTTFYRLVGPYRSPLAPHTVKTELWDTITRRGLIGNFVMGLIPMVFYLTVNGLALCLELVVTLGGIVRL
jgi:dimethylaniline monooxygenase (N-oxide forming)